MAWRLKRPLITVSYHDDLIVSDLAGRFLFSGGETVWVNGPLALADLLLALERLRQDFVLDWVARIASTNIQLAHLLTN